MNATHFALAEPRVTGTGPYPPAPSADDAAAREACARIAEQEGFRSWAELCRRGAYDGEHDHQVALLAIKLFREMN